MSKKKKQTQNNKPQKAIPPNRSERQSWTVPNIPPAIRPVHRPKPPQNNPQPESSKPMPDSSKPQSDNPKK